MVDKHRLTVYHPVPSVMRNTVHEETNYCGKQLSKTIQRPERADELGNGCRYSGAEEWEGVWG